MNAENQNSVYPAKVSGKDLPPALFDVRAVNIETGEERLMESGLTEANAEAFVTWAVIKRGVDEEFFVAVPSGKTHAKVAA